MSNEGDNSFNLGDLNRPPDYYFALSEQDQTLLTKIKEGTLTNTDWLKWFVGEFHALINFAADLYLTGQTSSQSLSLFGPRGIDQEYYLAHDLLRDDRTHLQESLERRKDAIDRFDAFTMDKIPTGIPSTNGEILRIEFDRPKKRKEIFEAMQSVHFTSAEKEDLQLLLDVYKKNVEQFGILYPEEDHT